LTHSDDMGMEVNGQVMINFSKVQSWKQGIIDKLSGGIHALLKGNQIEVIKGEAVFVDDHVICVTNGNSVNHYRFKDCIIATGSRPAEIPSLPFGNRILSSTSALEITELPKRLIVIGGGYIGIELGQAFSKFGTKVTILEGGSTILPGFEKRLSTMVNKRLKKADVDVYTNAVARGFTETENEITVRYQVSEEEKEITADYVLVTVGRKPNMDNLGLEAVGVQVDEKGLIAVNRQCKTSVPNIYAIGDIVPGLALAHKASFEGKVAAEVIAGKQSVISYRCIPTVVFSDPEIATVGLTETEASDLGYEPLLGEFSYTANGRALALNVREGMVTLVGDNATLEDIASTIHAHPTLGELIMEAAENAMGICIHSL